MTISPAGIDRIKRYEGGSRLTVYKDSAGLDTIGVGHLVKKGENFAGGITEEKALLLLRDDLQIAVLAVSRAIKVEISQDQYDSLVSLCFNIGVGNFAESSAVKAVNRGATGAEISACFMLWNKVTIAGKLVPSKGLTVRRADEASAWA